MRSPNSKRWRERNPSDPEEPAGPRGFGGPGPGHHLSIAMGAARVSATALAAHVDVPRSEIDAMLKEQRSISADIAARLARAFGGSAQFWLNLQNSYDLWEAEQSKKISRIQP